MRDTTAVVKLGVTAGDGPSDVSLFFCGVSLSLSAFFEDAALTMSCVAGAGENLENTMAAFKQ